jgi:hypothetical protein
MTELNKLKMGDIRESDGKMFWGYNKQKLKNGSIKTYEVWLTPERFKELKNQQKKYYSEYWYRPEVREKTKKTKEKYRKNPRTKKLINEYVKSRRAIDPQYALKDRVRARIRDAVKRFGANKSTSTKELVGCSYAFLREYIEKQFKDGMSWEIPHSFHIDHIRPLASFDLTNPEELSAACHYTNLQPLYPFENRSKGAKILTTTN